jgi:hypothetical protein
MSEENTETRPVELQGGRLCGLPNIRVKTHLDATEFVDDDTQVTYAYEKHHVNADGVDVFRIAEVRPPKKKKRSSKKE